MDPSDLIVYESPYPKRRLGKDYDGGYIIADVANIKYDSFLSGGIGRDISFEEDFIQAYSVNCIAFDGTIDALPKENSKIEFKKKNIGLENTNTVTNLHDIIKKYEHIFVKMDIEGGEIPWIKSLSSEHLNKFDQIVMEFHNPFSDKEKDIFKTINKTHILIHFHPNNCCGTRVYKGITMPNVFECTYLHKKYFTGVPKLNTEAIPGKLDMKNTSKAEISIDYPPFVHKKTLQQGDNVKN